MDKAKTKVIFRQWKIGCEIIALFPEIAGDITGRYCMSYMRTGQHSSATPEIIKDTKPVSGHDYYPLYKELTSLGYNLQIVKRFTNKHHEIRKSQVKR